MAANWNIDRLDQAADSAGQDFDRPEDGVAALAQSALNRLGRIDRPLPDNFPDAIAREADIPAFTDALIRGDLDTARHERLRLAKDGASYERIADTLIAGAARNLGLRWEKNRLSFVQVTLGISELLRINAELRRQTRGLFLSEGSLALFATLQGQAHTLGIVLAAEAFRQHGWDVEMILDSSIEEIFAEAQESRPVLIGLTAGRDDRLSDVSTLLARLKTLRPAPKTILGGHAVADTGILAHIRDVDEVVMSIEDALVAAGRPS